MTATPEKYTYLISYSSPRGASGHFAAHFAAPITSQDLPGLDRLVREHGAPGAIVLGFSPLAPDRVDGKVQRDATLAELKAATDIILDAAEKVHIDLVAKMQAMAEEIETLKREAGLLP